MRASPIQQVSLRYTIRQDDRASIQSIVERTGFFSPEEIAIAIELVDEALLGGPESGYEFLLVDGPAGLVGYACVGPIPGTTGSADLYWLVVDPAFQGQGIGQRIMAAAEEYLRARGTRKLFVDTSGKPQYFPTIRFYERCGFVQEARLEDFFGIGDPKIIFSKRLS
jgi:ribosomal protein S18 acetylase RimI-like enzyme